MRYMLCKALCELPLLHRVFFFVLHWEKVPHQFPYKLFCPIRQRVIGHDLLRNAVAIGDVELSTDRCIADLRFIFCIIPLVIIIPIIFA